MEKTPESIYLIVFSMSLEQSLFQTRKENQKKKHGNNVLGKSLRKISLGQLVGLGFFI